MNDVQPSKQDILADAKRSFRWRHMLSNLLWMPALFIAIRHLNDPTVVGNSRLLWFLAPLPFFVLAYWSWASLERTRDELQQAMNGRAAVVAFRLTLFWLFALVLVDAAVGLPVRIPGPFGLPDDTFGWMEAAMVPLFFMVGAGVREQMRVFPRRPK
jgi:hypothetical protein